MTDDEIIEEFRTYGIERTRWISFGWGDDGEPNAYVDGEEYFASVEEIEPGIYRFSLGMPKSVVEPPDGVQLTNIRLWSDPIPDTPNDKQDPTE